MTTGRRNASAAGQVGRVTRPANPFRHLLGVRVTDRADGTATVVIDSVSSHLLQAGRIVHDGVCATLVDCAAGEALRTVLEPADVAFTIDLNVSYLLPVNAGLLQGRGRVLQRGRCLAVCVTDIYDGSAAFVATGRASFAVRAARRAADPESGAS